MLSAFEGIETYRELAATVRELAERTDFTVLGLLRRELWRQARYIHPKRYREDILKTMQQTLVDRLNRARELEPEDYPSEPIEGYDEFLRVVREYSEDPDYDSPLLLLYEGLLAAHAVFLEEEPVHPPGTTFPGVGRVREEDGTYYCPIKRLREDQPGSFCAVCPAEQDPEVSP